MGGSGRSALLAGTVSMKQRSSFDWHFSGCVFPPGKSRRIPIDPIFAEFEGDPEILEERRFTLRQIAPRANDGFIYEYDFGDSWQHKVTVEQILPPATRPSRRRGGPAQGADGQGRMRWMSAALPWRHSRGRGRRPRGAGQAGGRSAVDHLDQRQAVGRGAVAGALGGGGGGEEAVEFGLGDAAGGDGDGGAG